MSLVRIEGVEKFFGELHVLKGINLAIEAGQAVSIIGKSGSGKSTLLRCINGLETHDGGRITVDGEVVDARISDLRGLRQKVGMVFQSFNLFPHLTAGENVMLAPTIVKKLPHREVEEIWREKHAQVRRS